MPLKKASLSFLIIGFFLVTLLQVYTLLKIQGGLTSTRVVDAIKNLDPPRLERPNEIADSLSSADKMFRLYDGVETFVLFIGYPRSCHSLVGAILDAHPEIIIPHEYNILAKLKKLQEQKQTKEYMKKYFLFHNLHMLSHDQALFGFRANDSLLIEKKFTYTYNVPGLWQGDFDKRIKVIGDKTGGSTTINLAEPGYVNTLEELGEIVKVPIKFIHVTRNPFDNIATIMLRAAALREKVTEEGAGKVRKVNRPKYLDDAITFYFRLAATNQHIRELYGDAVLDIPGHETVLRPRKTIQNLCHHLGVTCSDEYIQKCSKILYATPSVTRNTVVWSEEQKSRVGEMMKSYPFLKDYSFDKYPN